MKIVSITVVDGYAVAQLEGMETNIIVKEGMSLHLSMVAGAQQLTYHDRRDGSSMTVAYEKL